MAKGFTHLILLLLARGAVVRSQPSDTFKGCTVPDFDWAAYSGRSTARMYAMRGAATEDYVFAAGFVKSTIDTDKEDDRTEEFSLTGPYSVADPTGQDAETIMVDLKSYSASAGATENAGGSFGQYDIGLAKINALTGVPEDFLVIKGDAMDETTGLAAKGAAVVLSGHFTGNLTAELADGTIKTIWNSNIGEGGMVDDADQFHPNQKDAMAHTGNDDGFVIKSNSETGSVEWMVHYPKSNKDSQMISVDLDDDSNVFGSGYQCTMDEGAETKVCDAIVAMFASEDGSIVWEKSFPELGALFFIKHDREDGGLYVAGTTTYGGASEGAKDHPHCPDDSCSVVMRLDSSDGTIDWVRTVKGSARWGVFDQSGGLELADEEKDGPYIYVALDDTGDGAVEMEASLQQGTSYGGCMSLNGTFTPEYHVFLKKVVTPEDCDFYDDSGNSRYISRESVEAQLASSVTKNVRCGNNGGSDACLMKYHKFTGLPMWAIDVPPVAGLVPSSDGSAVDIAGWYYPGRAAAYFDSVILPGYLREGGLGSQTSGIYNARIAAETGRGEYVVHSGGGSKDRLYDMVGDRKGNLYNIGYSMNLKMNWGGNLETTMVEKDVDPIDATSEAVETHMYVSKLAAATEEIPPCLTTCAEDTDQAVINDASCFIDGKCYAAGDNGNAFGKSCFACDPTVSQREWTEGPTLGLTQCFVDNMCVDSGVALFYQRRTWSAKIFSECQVCDPKDNATSWSLKDEFIVDEGKSPPDDCTPASSIDSTVAGSSIDSPVPAPADAPVADLPPTNAPIAAPAKAFGDNLEDAMTFSTENSGLSRVAIACIVIGCIVGLSFIGAAYVYIVRRRKLVEGGREFTSTAV